MFAKVAIYGGGLYIGGATTWASGGSEDTCIYQGVEEAPGALLSRLGLVPIEGAMCTSRLPIFPASTDTHTMTLRADGESLISKQGLTVLQKNVQMTQGSYRVFADKVCVQGGVKTGLSSLDLLGGVRFISPWVQMVAQQGHWRSQGGVLDVENLAYAMPYNANHTSQIGWGTARLGSKDAAGRLTFEAASFSTCHVTHPSWQLKAHRAQFDRAHGTAKLWRTTLYWKSVPVGYIPFLMYPITSKRHSGFLLPELGFGGSNGAQVSLPFYWNIAPNMDALLTNRWMSRRGLVEQMKTRFLTTHSSGWIRGLYVPHDRAFSHFREGIQATYTPAGGWLDKSYDQLLRQSLQRYGIVGEVDVDLARHWRATAKINRVGDNYIPSDFSDWLGSSSYQLPSALSLHYASTHTDADLTGLSYQILHPIDQGQVAVLYNRVPSLNWVSHNLALWGQYDLNVSGDLTRYVRAEQDGDPAPHQGDRVWVKPTLEHPWAYRAWGGLARLGFNIKQVGNLSGDAVYHSQYNGVELAELSGHASATLPGLRSWDSTSSMRWLYRYSGYRDQKQVPIFDSALLPFTLDNLFAPSRFEGHDLIADANEMVWRIDQQMVSQHDRATTLGISLGGLVAFHKHRVCMEDSCLYDDNARHALAPLLGQVRYQHPHWGDWLGELSWSGAERPAWRYKNLQWQKDIHQGDLIKLHYTAYHNRPPGVMDLQDGVAHNERIWQVDIEKKWLSAWTFLFSWQYQDYQDKYVQSRIGLNYQACCWALHAGVTQKRTYDTIDPHMHYNIALGLSLSGLGQLGSR